MPDTHNLPAIPFDLAKMSVSLLQVAREAVPSAAFLRMNKDGVWCFGVEAEEIDEDQQFLVNPGGFGHGYVCWTDPDKVKTAEKLGETYAPVSDVLPMNGPVPPTGRGWEFQLGLALKGFKGTHDGVDMVFRTSSVGGKRAVAGLSKLVGTRMATMVANMKDDEIVPVVTLGSDSYLHRNRAYGKIYVPEFNIVRWISLPHPGAVKPEVEERAAKRNGKRR